MSCAATAGREIEIESGEAGGSEFMSRVGRLVYLLWGNVSFWQEALAEKLGARCFVPNTCSVFRRKDRHHTRSQRFDAFKKNKYSKVIFRVISEIESEMDKDAADEAAKPRADFAQRAAAKEAGVLGLETCASLDIGKRGVGLRRPGRASSWPERQTSSAAPAHEPRARRRRSGRTDRHRSSPITITDHHRGEDRRGGGDQRPHRSLGGRPPREV